MKSKLASPSLNDVQIHLETNTFGSHIFQNMYLITNIKLNDYCKMVQIMEIVLSQSPKVISTQENEPIEK